MSKTVLFDTWTWNYDFDDSMPNLKKVVEDAGKKIYHICGGNQQIQ